MRRLLAALICLLSLASAASAQSVDELLAKFASTKFDDIEAGISGLATSGSPQATAILDALGAGNLLIQPAQRRAYIKAPDGSLLDAATGEAAPADLVAASLKPVRVNNRIRRAIEAAVGSLTLMNPDPARRLEAAQAVFRSRDAAALPALEQAFAAEQDPSVKQALAEARAAILLPMPSAADSVRLAAVETLRERGDRESLAILAAVPATAPDNVRARRGGRHCDHRAASRHRRRRPEHRLRHQPRLGPAAGRDRPRHHLRRDGRDQHGAWRDGHARRLHHLRHPGVLPHQLPGRPGAVAARWPCPRPSWSRAPWAC